MKTVLYLLFILCAVRVAAQEKTLDHAYLKCMYRHDYAFDTLTGADRRDDLLILQVGPRVSKCYSYYTFQSDSLRRTPDGRRKWAEMFSRATAKDGINATFPHKRMKTYVYKNYPEGKMTVTDGLSLQDYVYEDSLGAQSWAVGDSTKQVLGYVCQQATCDFRGRHWTAWFAADIPVSDGPWKLGGLPGLILEAYDRGHQYVFTAVGLERVADEPIVFSRSYVGSHRFEQTTRLDFLRAEKKYLMDINGYIRMETGIDLDGDEPARVMRYDLLERDY